MKQRHTDQSNTINDVVIKNKKKETALQKHVMYTQITKQAEAC